MFCEVQVAFRIIVPLFSGLSSTVSESFPPPSPILGSSVRCINDHFIDLHHDIIIEAFSKHHQERGYKGLMAQVAGQTNKVLIIRAFLELF